MKKAFIILSCCTALIFAGCNNEPEDSKDVAEETNEQRLDSTNLEDDAEFAVKAADGGMMEVQLGNLAKSNASSKEVKDFGAMMVKDHSAGNDELKALAQQKNITLPTALSNDNQEKMTKFSKLKGADFDKEYISFMVEDHKEDIEKFTEQSEKGNDAALKTWAAGKVPVLQHHLREAQAIDSVINKK